MSDLNDDLLNYELGEELDELVGDDDLLLSDEELEKEKAALKDEAEQWVSSKLKVTDEENEKDVPIKEPEQVSTTSSACKNELDENDSPNCSQGTTIKNNSNSESDVSTSGESPVKKNQIKNNIEENEQSLEENIIHENENITKIDEVTSTNKEVELDSVGILQTQNTIVKDDGIVISSQGSSNIEQSADHDAGEDGDGDEQQLRGERTNIKHTNERDDNADSSPEKYSHGGNVSGRYMHPKRGVGRGVIRGGIFPGQRPPLPVRYPHINYSQYPHHPNENINPQQVPPNQYPPPHQYHQSINNPMPPRPPQFHPQNNGPRMEYRPNFRYQNDYNNGSGSMFNPRGPRPDFTGQGHPNGPPYNSFPHQQNNLRPMFRPEMQHMRPRMPLRPPSAGMPPINYSTAAVGSGQGPPSIQSHAQHHPHSLSPHGGNIMGSQIPTSGSSASSTTQSGPGNNVLPRKVLINPNFKGGVEAATNQLMKDTQFMQSINSHVPHLQSDEELLRQQEEFINKNRIHIQKRYARSPDRNRERSYSPPMRKDRYLDNRDNRRGFGGSRGRGRRASSREMEIKFAKRRRSCSPDRKRDRDQNEEPEDEETRAYRLEIEKQKAMREKILRDKEMRRRKAAEGKTQIDEASSLPDDQPPAKLKPIIVTESKIISLKKNKEIEKNSNPSTIPTTAINPTSGGKPIIAETQQSQQHFALKRTLPTAKILPEAKRNINEHLKKEITAVGTSTTAVVRPVIKNKQTATVQTDFNKDDILDDYEDEDELLEEERLLADTPSPPSHTPNDTDDSDSNNNNADDDENDEPEIKKSNKGFMTSSNRKVVLKSSSLSTTAPSADFKSKKTTERLVRTKTVDSKKRIFDRLEKKKIGVNDNDKRRIQRIFIKNME